MSDPRDLPSVPPALYDERYYTICEGYDQFARSGGLQLSPRLAAALAAADLRPGMWALDLGCGRGEVLFHCAAAGVHAWGLDYSPAAAGIARAAAARLGGEVERLTAVQVANVKALPFRNAVLDRVFMFDLVEHLYPWELDRALAEAYRCLRPGGRLVLHTLPNRWYYRVGYPLYRFLNRLAGRRLPRNPRDRTECNADVHVNEQDVLRLKASLRRHGFSPRVWLANVTSPPPGRGWVAQAIGRVVALPGLRLFLCNDLFAVGVKEESHGAA